MQQFGQTAATLIGSYAGAKSAELQAQADQETDPAKRQELLNESGKWAEGGAYRVAAHAAAGALGGGVLGAAGAAASAALVPTIAQALDALDPNLPAAVRAVVIAAAGTATGAVVSGASGAAAAANQTVNNYLKHEELQAKRQEMAACKTEACTTAVTRKWEAVSQKRDEQLTGSCLDGTSAQCHANVQQLMTDLAALNQGEGKSKSPESEEEGQNIREVQTLLRVNVDQLVQRGVAAMGENAKSLNDLVKAGYLTPTEAEVVKSQPGEMLNKAHEVIAATLGAKVSSNRALTEEMRSGTAKVVPGSKGADVAGGVGSRVSIEIQNVESPAPPSSLGKVVSTHSAIEPGPLDASMAETFAGGRYSIVEIGRDSTLYRAGTAGKPLGQFFDTTPPTSVLQTRIDKAILPTWPNGATSPLDTWFAVSVPKGTSVYVGEIGTQGGFYVGGTQQVIILQPWKIDGIKVLRSGPLK